MKEGLLLQSFCFYLEKRVMRVASRDATRDHALAFCVKAKSWLRPNKAASQDLAVERDCSRPAGTVSLCVTATAATRVKTRSPATAAVSVLVCSRRLRRRLPSPATAAQSLLPTPLPHYNWSLRLTKVDHSTYVLCEPGILQKLVSTIFTYLLIGSPGGRKDLRFGFPYPTSAFLGACRD